MNLQSIFIAMVDGVPVIQDGESTITVDNKTASYTNPYSKNTIFDLGAGQQKISFSFHVTSEAASALLYDKLLNKRKITILDKFLGSFNIIIESFERANSDSHIGVTRFRLTAVVVEEDSPFAFTGSLPAQLISSSLLLMDAVTLSLNLKNNLNVQSVLTTISLVTSSFSNSLNFGNTSLSALSNAKNILNSIAENALYFASNSNIFKDIMFEIKNTFKKSYKTSRDAFIAVDTIPTLEKKTALTISNFELVDVENYNLIANASNTIKAALMIDCLADIEFYSTDDANNYQAKVFNILDNILGIDDSVEQIKNNISHYIQSLTLPKETTITVSEKPLLVLTYEIYGETESFDKILNLNNFTEFDDLGGIVRVLE